MRYAKALELIERAVQSAHEAELAAREGNGASAYVANEWALYLLDLARVRLGANLDDHEANELLKRISCIENEIREEP